MYCNACGCRMEETDKFCPACGAKYEPATVVYPAAPAPTKEYGALPTKEYAPVDSGAPDRTVMMDGYDDPAYFEEDFAEPLNAEGAYPEPYDRQYQPPRGYQDSFYQQDGEDAYYSQNQPYQRYQKTTAGRRAASVFLCLMMLLFGFLTMLIATARVGLREDNVRKAYQKGSLADMTVSTKDGDKTLTDVIAQSMVDATTNLPISVDKTEVEKFLRSQNINTFAENLVLDMTGFFVFGRTPTLLNSKEITGFLTNMSGEIRDRIGYSMSDEDIANIGKRIDGGDLSFLSIDKDGNYFKQAYHFDPYVLSKGFSIWALVIGGVLVLLCMLMIFIINSRNLPAGLSFNGSTMIIFGVINTLIAAGGLALSYAKPVFLFSELLRSCAMVMGAISLVVLVIGIIFSVIKTVLRNRIS